MIKEEQKPVGPVLTAAESRRRVLHNMCSSLLYNLSVILFGLLLPRLYLTSFGSELNGLDSTIKQIFSCLTLLEAGVGLASQQAYYLPVAVGDRKAINGIFRLRITITAAPVSCICWSRWCLRCCTPCASTQCCPTAP